MWDSTTLLNDLLLILNNTHEWDIVLIILGLTFLFWGLVSFGMIYLFPRRYRAYRREIVIFMMIMNFTLLFMGVLFTLVMLLFGIAWATHRMSRPSYEEMDFEEYYAKLPVINSQFHEGIIDVSTHGHWADISTDEKIKSLKILYESNDQNNIGRIKNFLGDSSEETRLYAFSLVSAYEKELNDNLKKLQKLFNHASDIEEAEHYAYLLAENYWQFIFHGVADGHLTTFYTEKIESILDRSRSTARVSMLLGKIYLFNHNLETAQQHFHHALEQGMDPAVVNPYLAEVAYERKEFNRIADYIMSEEHTVSLRLKPICQMWSPSCK